MLRSARCQRARCRRSISWWERPTPSSMAFVGRLSGGSLELRGAASPAGGPVRHTGSVQVLYDALLGQRPRPSGKSNLLDRAAREDVPRFETNPWTPRSSLSTAT
jgi:hypothetical protein